VKVVTTSSETVTNTIALGASTGAQNLATSPDGSKVYVTSNQSNVKVITTSSDTVTNTISLSGTPYDVAFNPAVPSASLSPSTSRSPSASNSASLSQSHST